MGTAHARAGEQDCDVLGVCPNYLLIDSGPVRDGLIPALIARMGV